MEIFWFVMGVSILIFAGYCYVNELYLNDQKYMVIAGSMAILLTVFRRFYRKQM